ncbi:MAG: pyridoxal kinase PdxY [Rectinemataceae bacterium]
MAILSIQSHVAYGHVGNRAAVFPLERLGYEVWPINTVQFSNHTGYSSWTGEVFTAAHIELVWSGVKARGRIGDCEAVLSGYLGTAEVGHLILQAVDEVKAAHPGALYCCDPVMGDYGNNFFVDEGVCEFISEHAVRAADIVTPNQFEAEKISDCVIASIDDAKRSCGLIHEMGPSVVLITSFKPNDNGDSAISMFLSSKEGFRMLTTTELPFDPPLSGAGDLASALFLARYLEGRDPVRALELMADSVYAVFEHTFADRETELRIVAAQEEIAHPKQRFEAEKV